MPSESAARFFIQFRQRLTPGAWTTGLMAHGTAHAFNSYCDVVTVNSLADLHGLKGIHFLQDSSCSAPDEALYFHQSYSGCSLPVYCHWGQLEPCQP